MCKTRGVTVCTKFKRMELGELAGQFRMKGNVNASRMGKVHNASTLAIMDFGGKLNEGDLAQFNVLLQ
ncbi:Ribosomal_protein S12 [Hexamita inflata]|uniref:Ribosomal_protein S12 n=1 Tax=Hexamita inflata TaxID=28002 RepID=A0ABP1HDV3_9EUKA